MTGTTIATAYGEPLDNGADASLALGTDTVYFIGSDHVFSVPRATAAATPQTLADLLTPSGVLADGIIGLDDQYLYLRAAPTARAPAARPRPATCCAWPAERRRSVTKARRDRRRSEPSAIRPSQICSQVSKISAVGESRAPWRGQLPHGVTERSPPSPLAAFGRTNPEQVD